MFGDVAIMVQKKRQKQLESASKFHTDDSRYS